MKKFILISLLVLLLIAVIGGSVAFYELNRRFGILESDRVSHETLTKEDTCIRLVVQPDAIGEKLNSILGQQLNLPSWVPMDSEELVKKILPWEVALLTNTNLKENKMGLLFFINEKRGGPAMIEEGNKARILERYPNVSWDEEGITSSGRGIVTVSGSVSLPSGMEEEILEHWEILNLKEPFTVHGDSHLEITLDNRNGGAYALAAAMTTMAGSDWKQFTSNPMFSMVQDVMHGIHTGRLTGNWVRKDEAIFFLSIDTTEENYGSLLFALNGFVITPLQDTLNRKYGLTLAGNARWNEKLQAITGTYSVKGIEKMIAQRFKVTSSPAKN